GDDRLDGQGAPISRWPTANDGLIDRLVPGIIWQPRIGKVDGNTFRGNRRPIRGESEADHQSGPMALHLGFQFLIRHSENARQNVANDSMTGDQGAVQLLRDFAGRIEDVSSKGLEA